MTTPVLAADRSELDSSVLPARAAGRSVVLVPTMGALHEGHATLLRHARERAGSGGVVVASVFVNPLQFGPAEDLDRYPRTLDADLKLCEREGVDVVFAPAVELMYPAWPDPPQITVDPGPLGDVLEGKTRPGHFRGVLTVVARLFALVRPDRAQFGEKDYQQLALVRTMTAEFFPDLVVDGVETQREPDGLALSSRNRYLDADQRREAVALSRALYAAHHAAVDGADAALAAARAQLRRSNLVDLDYLVITQPDLSDLPADLPPGTPARALIAARVGTTRLIDNLPLILGGPPPSAPVGAFPTSEAST